MSDLNDPATTKPFIEKSGIVPYRVTEEQNIEVLVIKARKYPSSWIFPVGTVSRLETLADAAIRVCRAESGQIVELGSEVNVIKVEESDSISRMTFYLGEVIGNVSVYDRDRQQRWVSLRDLEHVVTEVFAPVASRAAEILGSGSLNKRPSPKTKGTKFDPPKEVQEQNAEQIEPETAELADQISESHVKARWTPIDGGEIEQLTETPADDTNEQKLRTEQPPLEVVTRNSVANDQLPIKDELHYDDYARALAEVLVSEETTTPLTVGIYGAWGMGKSFLMRRVKEMVAQWPKDVLGIRPDAKKPKHEFHFVEFNA